MSTDMDSASPSPWERTQWHGDLVSIDGISPADFSREDVAEIIAWGTTPNDGHWSGETAGIARLKDGRFIGREEDWAPTGHGFCLGAYGGESDILFAANAERLLVELSPRGRELLGGLNWRWDRPYCAHL